MERRSFFKTALVGGASVLTAPAIGEMAAIGGEASVTGAKTAVDKTDNIHTGATGRQSTVKSAADLSAQPAAKPETNIATALAIPRTANSLPGKYPGKVVSASRNDCITDGKPSESIAYTMLKDCMTKLSGEPDLKKAWLQFVGPDDVIGIKVNPIGGKLLSTSHAITKSIIRQLTEAGISKSRIIIWDRRQESLEDADYIAENYPGIQLMSTECYDENKSYINSEGRFYSEDWIDKHHFYYADVEGEYDAETLPYMVNGGKQSYFSNICTEKVTKIINVPVLKNAGTSITCCMKNLAFGAITNTGRLHKDLWHDTCAEVCAFPPLRDKVTLNIADALLGCFDGGPAANPQFICQYNTFLGCNKIPQGTHFGFRRQSRPDSHPERYTFPGRLVPA